MKTFLNKTTLILIAFCAVLCAGCKDEDQLTAKAPTTTQKMASSELVLFTWPDYIDLDVIDQFTKETGIHVKIETFDGLLQMKAYLRSKPDQYDVVMLSDVNTSELSELRLISPINHEAIPNIANISDEFLNLDFDPGNRYSIPYAWGTVLVAYRSDKIESPEKSWSLLWDENLRGRIAMIEEKEDIFGVGLFAEGFSIRSENREELLQVADKMLDHAKTMRPKYLGLEDVKSQLNSGEIWASFCYSGDALTLAEENENVSYFIPEEGAPLWIDSFAIARDAPNVDNAHLFIDFMARGKIAGQSANYIWSASPNKAATPYLDPDLTTNDTVFLDSETFAKCDYYALPTAAREQIMNVGMTAIMNEIRHSITDTKSAE